jgi:hypothetical protein
MAQRNNDNDKYVGLQTFVGGESQNNKFGGKYQYAYGRHIDVRKNASGFSVLPGPVKASAGAVTDLVLDMEQVPSGIRYAVGDSGNVYKITTANVWSKIGNIGEASGAGILYRADADCIYITGQTKVARIKNVSTTPVFQPNWFANGRSTATTCFKTGGAAQYTVPSTINEVPTDMRTFVVDIEPGYQIGLKVVTAGTGNVTLTLHDDANNVLSTVTVAASSLIPGQVNYFVFPAQVRLLPSINNYTSTSSGGRTYHVHTTTSGSGTILQTTTANSLADCDMEYWAYALVQTANGLHPIEQFANLTLIGNDKYTASYAPLQDIPTTADFLRHQLTFPPNYQVCGIAQLELYACIMIEQRSSSATQDFQAGKMILWDGIQTTYNRFFDIPEGSPEAVFSHKNVVYFDAGGALYMSSGGQPQKVRTYRNTDSEFSQVADATHSYPRMKTVRRGILLNGYPSSTTNQQLEHAVYGYGQINAQFPNAWTTSYTISTGSILNNGTNNLRLGMVKNFGDTLYMSWRDDSQPGGKYGVDIVNNSTPLATDFQIRLLYFDNDQPYKEKLGKRGMAVFDSLPIDGSISLNMYYILNGDGVKHYMTDDNTPLITTGNVVQVRVPKQFIGLEIGIEGTIDITKNPYASPFCRSIDIVFDPESDRSELSAIAGAST